MSTNGETSDPLVPSELRILLSQYSNDADRDAVRKAYYHCAAGDPNTAPVEWAVLIAANAQLLVTYPKYLKKILQIETKKLGDEISAQQATVKQSATTIIQACSESNKQVVAVRQFVDATEDRVNGKFRELEEKAERQTLRIEKAAQTAAEKVELLKAISTNLVIAAVVFGGVAGLVAAILFLAWGH